MINGVNHSSSYAFVGQYAVKKEHRGKGVGHAMWEKMIEHVGHERNISLSAAEAMFPIYRDKLGFKFVSEKRALRFEGKPKWDQLVKKVENITVLKVNEYNIQQIIEYDKEVCDGLDRRVFLTESMKIPEYMFLCALDGSGHVRGYCLAVTSNLEYVLFQPLYADNADIAQLLLYKMCIMMKSSIEKNGVWLQTWACNEKATDIANKMGLEISSNDSFLFTKCVYHGNGEKIYFTCSPSHYSF